MSIANLARIRQPSPWRAVGLVLCVGIALGPRPARGQATVRDITQPIPVVNAAGHSAPVRSLIFVPPGGSFLLSGGMDKVVNVWDLRGPRPALAQTIRPRIWRGYAGMVYALALSAPGADGQRVLAVAGYGVDANRGEINLFRFPGANNRPTGDLIGQFPAGNNAEAPPKGHIGNVTCLAFDPTGRFLASGSQDSTVRIWDVANRATVAILGGHAAGTAVNSLAFTPDGTRLFSGSGDGHVILWDVTQRRELGHVIPDAARHRDGAAGAAINQNMLAITRDGNWVVIGRENGDLIRYDGALRTAQLLNERAKNAQGPIEGLAISPDGALLATSAVRTPVAGAERPRPECVIELRRLPDGQLVRRVAETTNLAYALAFSPDGKRLAFAGGDEQAITLTDLADPNRPPVVLEGQGGSIWDVGWAADSRVIGYSRKRLEPVESYDDFDLSEQRAAPFRREDLKRAVPTWDGWRIEPRTPYRVDVLNARNEGRALTLDPAYDRRWWSYSIIPPGPGHPGATVAVGCEAGVAIYRLDTGQRTRLYAGHGGAVYAIAPSPDGQWLLTGSVDQTIRFWRLAGCDTLAPLGVTFGPAERGLGKVTAVEKGGFGDKGGLNVGDVIEKCQSWETPVTDLKALNTVPPDVPIVFWVRRDGKEVLAGTTKRDAPALTLFAARDGEWIVWTPSGIYETSPLGDRKYLGWHRNRPNLLPGDTVQPTDFFAFDHFENDLRKPAALLDLLRTANLAALQPAPAVVARAPEQILREDRLPKVEMTAPLRPAFDPLAVQGAALPVRVQAVSEDAVAGRGLIQRLRILVDSARLPDVAINPPAAAVDRPVNLNLSPGRHRVTVVAVNDRGKERAESFDVIAQEPARPAPPVEATLESPRLIVLTIGEGRFASAGAGVPSIPFAAEDARDVGRFLGAPGGKPRFQRPEVQALVGAEATSGRVSAALKTLEERGQKGELGQGDSVFLMIESHFVSFEKKEGLLTADATVDSLKAPSIAAEQVTEMLGLLADYGCKVVLLVDAVHERRPGAQTGNRAMNEWARQLYQRNVITFVASIHGPGLRHLTHGAFAEAVLTSANAQGNARLLPNAAGPTSLFDFQDAVARNVLALTDRRQHARCYVPDTIPSQAPIFDPPARRQPNMVRAARD